MKDERRKMKAGERPTGDRTTEHPAKVLALSAARFPVGTASFLSPVGRSRGRGPRVRSKGSPVLAVPWAPGLWMPAFRGLPRLAAGPRKTWCVGGAAPDEVLLFR